MKSKNYSDKLLSKLSHIKLVKYKQKKNIVIFSRHHINSTIRQVILAKCFNKLLKTRAIAVCEKKGDKSDLFYKKLNFDEIIYFSEFFNKRKLNFFLNLKIFFGFLKEFIRILFLNNYIDIFIKKFKYKNILLGDLIYDTYIRHDFKFLNLNRFKCAISFFRLYYIAKCKIDFIEKINNYYKPKKIIISSKGFISSGCLALRYFSVKQKKPIFFADNSYKIYKKNEYLYSFHNITKDDLKKVKASKKKSEIIKYFDRKYNKLELNENTFVKYHIIENAYKKKNNKKKFFIDSSQKIVILALNAFSDSPHYQGKLLFRDFYEWIEETLKFISKNNILNVTWLVKVHPAQFKTDRMSYDEITIVKKLIQKYKSNNIRMISDEISNPKLFSLATHCITCVSTIGLEFACHGKKPIICGDAIYNGLGFTNCILNKNKYFNTLKNLPNTNKLNTSEIHSAKSVIFLLDKIKQNELGIKNNLLPFRYNKSKAANDNEYIFDLYHKLKNNNQKITDNEYYKKVFNVTKHIFSKS